MKAFRHTRPVNADDLAAARAAYQKCSAASGAEKTRMLREHSTALAWYGWYIRCVDPSEGEAPARSKVAAQIQTPCAPSDLKSGDTNAINAQHQKPRVAVFNLNGKECTAPLSPTWFAHSGTATFTNPPRFRCGSFYLGMIRSHREAMKLSGCTHLREFTEKGGATVWFKY